MRPDYLPLVCFARASGLRLRECLLRKDQVDWHNGKVHTVGKGDQTISQPITSEMREILKRTLSTATILTTSSLILPSALVEGEGGSRKDQQRPITPSGLKTMRAVRVKERLARSCRKTSHFTTCGTISPPSSYAKPEI